MNYQLTYGISGSYTVALKLFENVATLINESGVIILKGTDNGVIGVVPMTLDKSWWLEVVPAPVVAVKK